MLSVLIMMNEKKWLRKQIPFFLSETVSFKKKLPDSVLSAGVPVLASLLSEKDIKEYALSTLRSFVQVDVNIREALDSLEKVFSCDNDRFSRMASYCITFHYLTGVEPSMDKVDSLLSDPKLSIMSGALEACGVFLTTRKKYIQSLVSRLGRILVSEHTELRKSASAFLENAVRAGLNIEAVPDVISYLLERLERENSSAISYIISCAEKNRDTAGFVLQEIERLQLNMRGEVDKLIRCCRDVLTGGYTAVCNICRFIPADYTYYQEFNIPKEVFRLKPDNPISQGGLRRCSECGNYYTISYSVEYESPIDGMGCTEVFDIKRLYPPEALDILKDGQLEELEKSYDTLIRKAEVNLTHTERYLREDSASILVFHSLKRGDWKRMEDLLSNKEEHVRLTVLKIVSNRSLSEITPVIDVLEDLTEDKNNEIKKQSSILLWRYYFDKKTFNKMEKLISKEDPLIRSTAIHMITSDETIDMKPFMSVIRESMMSSDINLRFYAGEALKKAIYKKIDVSENIELLVRMSSHKDRRIRASSVSVLKDVMNLVGVAKVMPVLIELLSDRDDRGYDALMALKNIAAQRDISRAFPVLMGIVSDREDGRRNEVAYILQRALHCSLEKKQRNLLIEFFGKLLFDGSDVIKNCAAHTFKMLIKKNRDISIGLSDIMKMLTPERVTYIEGYFAQDVSNYLIKKNDWEKVNQLLKASQEVSSAAGRKLSEWAEKKKDISPCVPILKECLFSKFSCVREAAAAALAAFAKWEK